MPRKEFKSEDERSAFFKEMGKKLADWMDKETAMDEASRKYFEKQAKEKAAKEHGDSKATVAD